MPSRGTNSIGPSCTRGTQRMSHTSARRLVAAVASAAALLVPALVVTSGEASAVISGNVMSGTASPMWQTNGTVEAVVVANGVVYAGGNFTQVRPPGTAASSTQAVVRNRLAAFNASTGALITTFDANVNGSVRALAVSPDGSRLYVGGAFTSVRGTTRNRVAAVNPSTGALVAGFNPNAGS